MNLPRDGGHSVIPNAGPVGAALVATYNGSISSNAAITLNAATKFIEVAAIDKAILLRWGSSAASTSAFDAVIPANTVRGFAVPAKATTVNFIQQAATAILALVEFA